MKELLSLGDMINQLAVNPKTVYEMIYPSIKNLSPMIVGLNEIGFLTWVVRENKDGKTVEKFADYPLPINDIRICQAKFRPIEGKKNNDYWG